MSGGSHTLIVYANDTLGNTNSSSVTFFINTITESATYSTPIMETETGTFILNITADSITSFNSSLIYNGTERATTYNDLGYSNSSFVMVPTGNISFYWDYWLNGINYNSSTYYQIVNPIETLNVTSGNCMAGLSPAMCWDFKDEGNLTTYAENVDYNFKYGITNSSSKSIYGSISNTTGFCLCVNSTIL